MCAQKSFAYYQLHRNKSKFLDYTSDFFEKRNKLNCGDLTISSLYDDRVQFNEFVWVFNLRLAPKNVYFFCLIIWECNKSVTSSRLARNLKYTATAVTGIFNNFVTPLSWLDYFCAPPYFSWKNSMTPSFFMAPYSVENDSPLSEGKQKSAAFWVFFFKFLPPQIYILFPRCPPKSGAATVKEHRPNFKGVLSLS